MKELRIIQSGIDIQIVQKLLGRENTKSNFRLKYFQK